ncbi:MAG: hypothetical protein MH252_19665 [Thermosynechococcaceae cyanobacterium MS004]|nr:hypothetical protein [Thermosynechococcaceae cyanobacterium MS004]
MLKAKPLRTVGLMVLTVGVLSSLGKLLVQPQSLQNQSSRQLPQTLQLSGWTGTQRSPLPRSEVSTRYDIVLDAQEYRFRQRSTALTVQLRYVFNTDGSLDTLQEKWVTGRSPVRPTTQTSEQITALGYHALSTAPKETVPEKIQETTLDTCLNPHGKTTITRRQFLETRLRHDLNPIHLMQWSIGQTPLLNKQCIWMRLILHSTPHRSSSALSEQLYQTLKELYPQLMTTLHKPRS